MIIPPLIGILLLALTTVYGFFAELLALLLGARLLALERRGLKPALLTALVYTVVNSLMLSVSYLFGFISDLLSLILIYVSILFGAVLLIPLIKVFYKTPWKKALALWLMVLGTNTVLSVLLSLVLALITTMLRIIMP